MADLKITGLTGDTAPTGDDLLITVNDPGGTPANKKVLLSNAFQALVDNFQANTTNAAVVKPRIEIGWGVMTLTQPTLQYSETVTFATAFSALPVVILTPGGDAITASGSAYGTGGNVVSAQWWGKATTITATNFVAQLNAPTGGVTVDGFVWYQWIAIGPA